MPRLTQRKVFLSLVEEMQEHFDDDGRLKDGHLHSFERLIRRVAGNAPKSMNYHMPWIVGSALWYCSQERQFMPPAEDCHAKCRGGDAYGAALEVFRWLGSREEK